VLAEARELVHDADLIGLSCYSRGSRKARQVAALPAPAGEADDLGRPARIAQPG